MTAHGCEPMIATPRNGFLKTPNLAVYGGMAVGTETSVRRKKRPWWRKRNKTILAGITTLLVIIAAGVWTLVLVKRGVVGCGSGKCNLSFHC